MRYLNVITVLLIVQFGQSITVTLKTSVGSEAVFTTSERTGNISTCFVVHNDVIYSIYPNTNLTNAIYKGDNVACDFLLYDVNFDHAGRWTLQSAWTQNSNTINKDITVVDLYVSKDTVLLPTTLFETNEGNYVTVFPQYVFENLTNCSLIHVLEGSIKKYDLLNINQTNPGMELYGKCGVRLLVDESRYGTWDIVQNYGPHRMIKLRFQIRRLKKNNSLDDKVKLLWTPGLSAEISLSGDASKVLYCTIEEPSGQILFKNLAKSSGFCATQIYKVSNIHKGLWKIRYSVDSATEKIGFLEKKYNVEFVDIFKAQKINVTVNATNSQMVHLLCTLTDVQSEFCLFTKPDGSILNLPQGIGNNKYEYYGRGYNYKVSQTTYSDCGLTIQAPSADDFGLWECLFGRNGNPYRAFVSFIDAQAVNATGAYVPNHIHVKHGDSFTIECPKYAPLKYCQLYPPNVMPLLFRGEMRGLAAGICETIVQNADYKHAGNWSCLLGVIGGGEINVPNAIIVTVTDSYLHPNKSVIEIDEDEKPTLTCNLLPEKYALINYCRWHRPDGHRIHVENSAQYSSSYGKKSCSLTINEYNTKNIGNWTCYANFFDDSFEGVSNEEICTTISVIEKDNDKF